MCKKIEDIYSPLDELKAAAFQTLLLHPGTTECQDWIDILLEECGIEVVDAFGNDPGNVYASLFNLWEESYCDPATGIENSFHEWASVFATNHSLDSYYKLVEVYEKDAR
ncbi:hypothetical protein EVA_11598 [gut metagenome]|uniref:Uncharacterized protein n=1 Tax=gut metagenome TaxID=749906 RepID=J9GKT3_9ZZZZ